MKTYLAIAAIGGSIVLAGCATTSPTAAQAPASGVAANAQPKEDPVYMTGSRIPNKAAGGRMVTRVDGADYSRDKMNGVSGQPDPQ